MIYVIASITLKPGMRAEFVKKANELVVPQTNAEAGCIDYDLTESSADPNLAVFVERWETREALAAHLEAEHMLAWRPVSNPMIADRKVEIIHPENVEVL